MKPPRRPIFDLVAERLGEPLDAFLLTRRKAEESFGAIAYEIQARTKVAVTAESVRQWCKTAEAEAAREPTPQPKSRTRKKRGES